MGGEIRMDVTQFQSTLPQGERPAAIVIDSVGSDISIHAPTRGATVNSDIRICFDTISIHAPTRGATIKTEDLIDIATISIHAPTRGATSCRRYQKDILMISIHAPTRGATAISHKKIFLSSEIL